MFVGLTAAIAFDEWRADRARAVPEREMLAEIRSDLRQTGAISIPTSSRRERSSMRACGARRR